ncbi:MAG: response regulator [Verrucomicrobiaceae bacterium]|nr:MAG: response regulator [Verrucomicrobiaceae bacterium]
MARNVKLRYLVPAALALAMIVYGVITSAVNTRVNLRDRERVAHTHEVLDTLRDTLACMLDMETGQRGYVIVGDDAYLEPYQNAYGRVESLLNHLTELTSDNPEQQQRITKIREAIVQREHSLEQAVALRKSDGLEAAARYVKDGGGKQHMDLLRGLVRSMVHEEEVLLARRQDKLARSMQRTNITVIISGCVAILAGTTGAALLIMFISARDRAEIMRLQKEKAEGADRAKSDFLAMMSHEIRTPMNAILGFSELLHDNAQTPQEKHFAGAILSSGNSLLSLINDILDLSKIEAGKIDIQPETVVMAKFSENLQTLFSFRAEEKLLDFSVTMDGNVPVLLAFDALRLRQVLVNLAGNALKFSHEGSVNVHFSADPPQDDGSVRLHVAVTDTGIGISEEHLTEIFRPFFQVDSRQGRHFEGTGLGLSICNRLVEAMHGGLSVESAPGRGSIFRVSIPTHVVLIPVDEALDAVQPAVDFDRLLPSKILIVDDEPLNRELLRNYLAASRHEVYEAENGKQAVALALSLRPDLVLMDIRMPTMDGREALQKIRKNELTKSIPLVAITASSLLNSQQELKDMFDGFADKPISRVKLFNEIARFLPAAVPAKATDTAPLIIASVRPTARPLPPALRAELEQLHRTVWPDLAKLVPAQGTINFAGVLQGLAEKHDFAPLADLAGHLKESAEMMDFSEAGRLLREFPRILSDSSPSHD